MTARLRVHIWRHLRSSIVPLVIRWAAETMNLTLGLVAPLGNLRIPNFKLGLKMIRESKESRMIKMLKMVRKTNSS